MSSAALEIRYASSYRDSPPPADNDRTLACASARGSVNRNEA